MNERFQTKYSAAEDAVFLIDPEEGRIVDANGQAASLLSYDLEELRGLAVETVHPREMDIITSVFSDLKAGAIVRTDELTCLTRHHESIPVQVSFATASDCDDPLVVARVRDTRQRRQEEQLLYKLAEGTADVTGRDFFRAAAKHLAEGFGVRYAFVSEWANPEQTHARILALWDGDGFAEEAVYAVGSTPCECVLGGSVCFYPGRVLERFSFSLVGESYLGVPILDGDEVLGALVIGDDEPMDDVPIGIPILRIMASRAATEMKRLVAEDRLRASESRYRQFYNSTPMMLHSNDQDGRIVGVSDRWLETLGYKREEVMGRRPTEFLTEASRRYAEGVCIPRFRDDGRLYEEPLQFQRKDGRIVDVLLSAISERNDEGEITHSLAASVDVTEKKLLEAAVLEAAEREQRRLGRDLHDDLGQVLHGVRFMSDRLVDELKERESDLVPEAERVAMLMERAGRQVRQLVKGLNAVDLEPDELVPALRELARDLELTYADQGIAVEVLQLGEFLPDTGSQTVHLYRIAQEALANAARHSGATQVRLRLVGEPESLEMIISDNGHGFDTNACHSGYGRRIMAYRARLLGGSVESVLKIDAGTVVTVRSPLGVRNELSHSIG